MDLQRQIASAGPNRRRSGIMTEDDADVQERLRWIGYIFKTILDMLNENGKTLRLKTKEKIALDTNLAQVLESNGLKIECAL